MFRWCAYCQKFIGESLPYEDFTITHGVCPPCKRGRRYTEPKRLTRMEAMGAFLKVTTESARTLDVAKAMELFHSAIAMGIRPVDFLLCTVGPLLGEADRQNAGVSPPAQAQLQTTDFCDRLIKSVRQRLPSTVLQHPDVLLMTTESNQHLFSLPLLELWLEGEAISALSVPNGVSPADGHALYRKYLPKVVGFSLAMKEQTSAVRECVNRIAEAEKNPPLFIVGGFAVKTGEVSPGALPRTTLISNDVSLFAILKNHLALGFLLDLKRKSAN